MPGNGGSATSNAAAPSGSHTPNPNVVYTHSVRPSPNDWAAFAKWSFDSTNDVLPAHMIRYTLYSAIGARFGINAFLGTRQLEPRCRYEYCDFHGKGENSFGKNCPRGQAGSAGIGDKFGFGLLYMSPDMSRVAKYGQEAAENDHDKTFGYVVLTINVIIPKKCIYTTTRDDLINSGQSDRNFWWQKMGYSMIMVTDGIGGHLSDENSFDVALKDLSYAHITRCTTSLHKEVANPENGLEFCPGMEGVIVIDKVKALNIGIYATIELAEEARQISTTPWDVYDRVLAAVSGLSVDYMHVFVVWCLCGCLSHECECVWYLCKKSS